MQPSTNIFINYVSNSNYGSGSTHENKIIHLEKFLKDLSEMNILNISKPYRKLLEFDQYVDDDNDEIVHINKKSLRNNHKKVIGN